MPGGQLMITTDVENYPGFPEGITGPELMERFQKQAERFGTRIHMENVMQGGPLGAARSSSRARAADADAETVIIATGASAKWLDVQGRGPLQEPRRVRLRHLRRRLLQERRTCWWSAAATPRWRRPPTSRRSSSKVTVLHRRDSFRASKIMQERALQEPEDQVRLEHGGRGGAGRRARA